PPMTARVADARAAFRPAAHAARHDPGAARVLPRGAVGTRRSVDASFVDQLGERSLGGDDVAVVDCGAELRFEGWPATLLLSIDSSDAAVTFAWSPAADHLEVWLDGAVVSEQRDVLGRPWRGRVAYGRLDGRDFLLLDDQHSYAVEAPRAGTLPRPRTWLHVGAVGASPAALASLRVFRDVYAYREPVTSVGEARPWPKFVRPGHWFLLGDNAFDSRDSRQFGDVPIESFLGAPVAVIGPWSRARRLPR
ncbi:MAG: S26 family signal peptidase, partial [Planctomycetota bacterium]